MIIQHNGHTYEITTNGHPRDLLAAADIPQELLQSGGAFDYLAPGEVDDGDLRFFRYRGDYWDIRDCERACVPEWLGMWGQSYETAIVWRHSLDYAGEMDTAGIIAGYLQALPSEG